MESWSASPERGIYVTNDLGRREVGLVDAVHDLWLDLWFRLPKKHDRLNDILHVDHGLFVSAVPHREKSPSCDLVNESVHVCRISRAEHHGGANDQSTATGNAVSPRAVYAFGFQLSSPVDIRRGGRTGFGGGLLAITVDSDRGVEAEVLDPRFRHSLRNGPSAADVYGVERRLRDSKIMVCRCEVDHRIGTREGSGEGALVPDIPADVFDLGGEGIGR